MEALRKESATLSVMETAKHLGISRTLAYQLFNAEDFPSFRVGKRKLVRKTTLETWIAQMEGGGLAAR